MKVTGDWLTAPGTQAVMTMLEEGGHRALAVGGCVRNALIGAPVADIDIATDARPDRVGALAEAAGLRAVPTGIDHGTVTVIADGIPHEVTTFRRDVETDGRHAVVAFSDDVVEDAARRDFTMNALYANRGGTLVDPLGGLPDLRARCLRFVGDPEARIREDYLRILRFFRFHAWYGDAEEGIDSDALAACAANGEGLETLSAERVGAEMRKLLSAPDPAPSVSAMEKAGLLGRVWPGADPSDLGALVHFETEHGSWMRRAALMAGAPLVDRWRLSRAETKGMEIRRAALEDGAPVHEVAWRHGVAAARDVVLIRAAREKLAPVSDLEAVITDAASRTLPVKAADLPQSGPALGQALKKAERLWLESGFEMDREALIAAVS